MKKALIFLFIFGFMLSLAGQIPVQGKTGYWLIDAYGDTLNREAYDYLHPNGGPYFLAIDDGSFFYINDSGRIWWKQEFQVAYPFNGQYALVRKDGAYRYLSTQGLYFDSLSWPKAASSYGDFLIYGQDSGYVASPDGSILLRTPHLLFAASKGGIFEWDKEDQIVRQYIGREKRNFRRANEFTDVDTLAFNHQGYAFIESDGFFSVYDENGQMLFEKQARSNYYLSVFIMWGSYLYLDQIGNVSYRFENEIGAEPMIDATQSFYRNIDNRFGAAVLLAESFRDEGVVKLRGSDRWALYSERNKGVEGYFLFDEVLPSDDSNFLLVRQGIKWFMLEVNKDLLHPLPYRHVHPLGYAEQRFYGSNNNAPEFWDKTWAYHHWEDSVFSKEVYRFPKPKFNSDHWAPSKSYHLVFPDLLKLWRNDSLILVNTKGEELAVDAANPEQEFSLEHYFMPEFHLHTRNLKAIRKRHDYKSRRFKPYLELKGNRLIASIVNNTRDSVALSTQDHYVEINLQYRYSYKPEKWRNITRFNPESFGDYPVNYWVPAKHKLSKDLPLPPGDAYVSLRLKLISSHTAEAIYSEPIKYRIPSSLILGHPYFPEYGARNLSHFQWERQH